MHTEEFYLDMTRRGVSQTVRGNSLPVQGCTLSMAGGLVHSHLAFVILHSRLEEGNEYNHGQDHLWHTAGLAQKSARTNLRSDT